jgi:hypothetical protein
MSKGKKSQKSHLLQSKTVLACTYLCIRAKRKMPVMTRQVVGGVAKSSESFFFFLRERERERERERGEES